jgi:hypothetical protein
MTRVHLQKAHPIRNMSLALSAVVLSISCLSLPALAQGPESQAALPNPASATTPTMRVSPANAGTPDHSLTVGDRAHLYGRSVFSPETIVGPAFGAAIGQWEDEPPGWHQGAEGYGKRFASGVARRGIGETIRFGFAAADREDPRYFSSQNQGTWARTQHAVVSSFVSQTSSGRTIPAFSRFAGTYGAAFISNTWYPHNRAGAGDAARRGSTALASGVGFNLAREFLPFFRRSAH